ncbi:MAG: ATP-binding protein [Abitibacteriaceae bacterium]|nr:ATP-binding protein [Abditibacteriaceae bacterium]
MTKPQPRKTAPNKTAKGATQPKAKAMGQPDAQSSAEAAVGQPQEASVQLHIPASTEYVRVARLAVTGVASRMDFSYEEIEDIKLAVSEACNNAILHATPPPTAAALPSLPSVVITVTPYPDRIEISVADEGQVPVTTLQNAARKALDARIQSDPDSLAHLPESGFGLLLIQSLMDTVEHQADADSNTLIRMTKYLRGRGNVSATL